MTKNGHLAETLVGLHLVAFAVLMLKRFAQLSSHAQHPLAWCSPQRGWSESSEYDLRSRIRPVLGQNIRYRANETQGSASKGGSCSIKIGSSIHESAMCFT